METISGFDYIRLHFDAEGTPQRAGELSELTQRASQATDAVFIAHGFRNDENDATGWYSRFLQNFRQHIDGSFRDEMAGRRFVVGGVYWPSKPFSEDVRFEGATASADPATAEREKARERLRDLKDTVACAEQKPRLQKAMALLDRIDREPAVQDEFVDDVLSLLDDSEPEPGEGVERIRSKSGAELLRALATPIRSPAAFRDVDEGGTGGVGSGFIPGVEGGTAGIGTMFGSVLSRVNQFLNLTTWYVMKNRAGVVGASGVARTVRDLKAAAPALRVHLVGHSLGGRLMAGCAKSLAQPPMVQPDSLTLLEAAFSHFGFSADNGQGQSGFFREVVTRGVVKGPFLATFSAQDTVVGTIYAVASRLAGDNLEAVGDANDPYGGIGRNGAQKTAEADVQGLHQVGAPYRFAPGRILNLDGSNGLIKDHGDVTSPEITYAFASAVAAT